MAMTNPRLDRPRWWQWPTILSLDAPIVLLVWQAAAAATAGVAIGWPQRVVLAASVWLAYATDRWLEAWRLPAPMVRTPRHAFHQRRRWTIAAVAASVLVADITLAVASLSASDLFAGLWLALAAACYVLSHQWLHRAARWRAPKEVVVAVLLAAGVWLFVRHGPAAAVWPTVGLFALLCLTNISLISTWEVDVDRRHGQSSLALHSDAARRWIPLLPWLAALVAVVVAIAGAPAVRAVAACAFVSALLLAASDRLEPRTGWPLARVSSDLALLTPLVLVLR